VTTILIIKYIPDEAVRILKSGIRIMIPIGLIKSTSIIWSPCWRFSNFPNSQRSILWSESWTERISQRPLLSSDIEGGSRWKMSRLSSMNNANVRGKKSNLLNTQEGTTNLLPYIEREQEQGDLRLFHLFFFPVRIPCNLSGIFQPIFLTIQSP